MENRTPFEMEHGALMQQLLNKSLDTLNDIGHEFEKPARVWHDFHSAIATAPALTTHPTPPQPSSENTAA
ncbi:hypothetical protein BDF14DRAFT_1886192 [Spinellus fusiger]|nr:hypothetical protein BDF14DRAFT_1886192 [Spinellus fusiger]